MQLMGLSRNGHSFCSMCLATQDDLKMRNIRTCGVRTRQSYEESYKKYNTHGNNNKDHAKVSVC